MKKLNRILLITLLVFILTAAAVQAAEVNFSEEYFNKLAAKQIKFPKLKFLIISF